MIQHGYCRNQKIKQMKLKLRKALDHYPGKGCVCAAHHKLECACGSDADWTPRLTKIVEAWHEMSNCEMRLLCGELTKQEIRTVRAVLKSILITGT